MTKEEDLFLGVSQAIFIPKKELKDHQGIYTENVCDCVFMILEGKSGVLLYHRYFKDSSSLLTKMINDNFKEDENVNVIFWGGDILTERYIKEIEEKYTFPKTREINLKRKSNLEKTINKKTENFSFSIDQKRNYIYKNIKEFREIFKKESNLNIDRFSGKRNINHLLNALKKQK